MFDKRRVIKLSLVGLSFCIGFGYHAVISDIMKPVPTQTVHQVETGVEYVEPISIQPPTVVFETIEEPEEVVPETILTEDEKILIAKVVWAEAGNQDFQGKQLVVDTILNRVDDPDFPNTVEGVIYQKNQFAPPAKTYIWECYRAVEAECITRIDYDVLWFCNYKYLPYGTPAYKHGDHYFTWRASHE